MPTRCLILQKIQIQKSIKCQLIYEPVVVAVQTAPNHKDLFI